MAAAASEREDTTPAGLALYRKYRPATFAEVKGQEHVTGPLAQALRTGRINHAYLFSGPRGCGKTSSARILARSLNCVKGPTPEPCGVCDSCVALAPSGPGSIDVIEIDAASHGGVDDARELRERAFYTPVSGRFKIYIIDEAHMVTQQGFNALLKLVEEPPPHLKFIFATTEPEKVIATIRSRTHHYPFRLVPPSVLRDLMQDILRKEGVTVEEAVLPLVVRAGAGSVRDSLSILDQLLAGSDESGLSYERAVALLGFTDASLLDEIADAFAAADGAAVFRVVNRVIEGGHEPRRFAADLLDRFRDLIVLAAVPEAAEIGLLDLPPDRAELMTAQAERFGQAGLTRAAEIVSTGLDQMRGATSPRLLLELMCAQVLLPAAATDEKSLLARLERLESAGRGGPAPAPQASPRPPHSGQDHDAERARVASPAGTQAPEPARPQAPRPSASERPASERPAPHRPAPAQSAPAQPAPAQPASPQPAPAHSAPGQSPPGQSPPGQSPPGQSPPGQSPPGQSPPGQSAPGQSAPGQSAPGQSAPGQSAPAQPAPAQRAPEQPTPAEPTAGSAVPSAADSLRENWTAVLEAVKQESRVAWMLLRNASVLSLDDGVLTMRFPRDGEMKGFSVSGHDAVLKRVLSTGFGLTVTVKAVTGNAAAAGLRPGRPGPGSGGGRPAGPARPGSGPAVSATPAPEYVSPDFAGQHGESPYDEPPDDMPPDEMPPDEPSPDDRAVQATELTGMDLIQRELGGQVIGEIEG
jgi:DNA polymerase III subunit gamma/tau